MGSSIRANSQRIKREEGASVLWLNTQSLLLILAQCFTARHCLSQMSVFRDITLKKARQAEVVLYTEYLLFESFLWVRCRFHAVRCSLMWLLSCYPVSTDAFCHSGLTVLQKILDTAAERNWQVTSVNLDSLTETTFIKLLADLDYKDEFQIIIDCEMERLNSIINLVKHCKSNCPGKT